MRTNHPSLALAAACLVSLSVPGCLEVETTTRVKADGTIQRTVEIKGDASALAGGDYPLALRGPWDTRITRTGKKNGQLRASRTFQDVDALNAAIRGEPGKTLAFQASLEQHFLWFTTTFRYEETLARFYPFDAVPVTDFVSPREIDFYLHHEMEEEPYPTPGDSLAQDDASDRFNEWEQRNRFEAFFQVLSVGAERAGDPRLTVEHLAEKKEEFYRRASEGKLPSDVRQLEKEAATLFGEEPVRHAVEANREGFEEYDRKLEFLETVGTTGFKTHVEMPGLITDTNAQTIEGNTVSWSDYKGYGFVRDYMMWVESRQINWWAIILTGVIILALVGLFSASALRRSAVPARA
jgi:hypothetical protein